MTHPTLVWLRRDLRLGDQPAFHEALRQGGPVIPLFILSPDMEALGAAAKWRLGESLAALSKDLSSIGSTLILRRGDPAGVLDALIVETGAKTVVWSRLYSAAQIERDAAIKADLQARGLGAISVNASLLFEPWTAQTGQGGMFKVYSPFWRAVRDRHIDAPLPAVTKLPPPENWPASDALKDWALASAMNRGAAVLAKHSQPGESAALDKLTTFLETKIAGYKAKRDFLDRCATSTQSEHLSYGEISPRTLWNAGQSAMARGAAGAEHFLKEVVWREFAWHLMYHSPHIATRNWRDSWDAFPWRADNDDAMAWKQGRTGVALVDAAMREMYVTGRMHNRARMLVASYLTKHLLTDWRVGQRWFADCLTDWDEASNAMGWQWVAGSGPDAAPYFRIFNPELQAEKFDPNGQYRARWLRATGPEASAHALDFFDAVPRSWGFSPDMGPAQPAISLSAGRARALDALQGTKALP